MAYMQHVSGFRGVKYHVYKACTQIHSSFIPALLQTDYPVGKASLEVQKNTIFLFYFKLKIKVKMPFAF